MAQKIYFESSRTLMEFRLLPGYTPHDAVPESILLRTPLVYSAREEKRFTLNIPIVSAAMQSVSGPRMGIELAKCGGAAFIFCSQTIESQAEMVRAVKAYKSGFVHPKTVFPGMTISELHALRKETGYNHFPVLNERNEFIGMISRNDYDVRSHSEKRVAERMLPKEQLICGVNTLNLKTANSILMESHQPVLPIIDENGQLLYLVFRKDIYDHFDNPVQVVDDRKRFVAAAAINTHDYRDRVAALAEAGVDVVCVDSSDGFTGYQKDALRYITQHFPELPVIGGNIVTAEGFDFLVENGARAVKVGMGSGSICITQEQKGTGRGLATAIMKVVEARDEYFKKTGSYIPVCADGGIVNSKDISIALALGADYVMMGRYFARMEESPTEKVMMNNRIMKPYWGEGSNRAREWKQQRYHQAKFAEGVEGFVEYAGKLKDNIEITVSKIKSTMATCGVRSISELHEKAELEVVSALSIREGKVHDVFVPDSHETYGDMSY